MDLHTGAEALPFLEVGIPLDIPAQSKLSKH